MESFGSQASRLGNAFHEAARAKVLEQPVDFEGIKLRYGLNEEELAGIKYGIYNIQIAIPDGAIVLADSEQLTGMDGKLTGTPDLVIYVPESLTITDWKSGWADVEDPETNAQTIGYGFLVLEWLEKHGHKLPPRLVFLIVQPRLNQVKAFEISLNDFMARKKDILDIIERGENGAGKFVTGSWCNNCFKCMKCPAFAGEVRSLINLVYEVEEKQEDQQSIQESVLKRALPFAKAVTNVSKKITELAKALVDANGPLDLGGGQLYAKTVDFKREINARKAFEPLKEYFTEEEIWSAITLTLTAITELAREKKRGLSKVVENRLVEAGALTKEAAVSYRILKGGSNDYSSTGNGKELADASKKAC